MKKVLVINGPNLNLLGQREPGLYGSESLDAINRRLKVTAGAANISLEAFQSNSEADIIEKLHGARGDVDFVLINPAAFTHTSVAIRDALLAVEIPFIEIHLSNVHQREEFRQFSYLSDIAVGVITGLGALGYQLALQAVVEQLENK